MFLAERLIYLQLQKTGSTHVAEMLGRCIAGRQIGKHTLLTDYRTRRYVAGSIRKPWQ
jgi:hypothetical protein